MNTSVWSVCANIERTDDDQSTPCLNVASATCKGCFLVQYCGRECQKKHWSKHKSDCRSFLRRSTWQPSWVVEKRAPRFVVGDRRSSSPIGETKYLWGHVPAVDILRLHENEGLGFDKDCRLLFAASGDLRNMIKSVTSLPPTFQRHCEVFMNDMDLDIVARNTILLLTAFCFDREPAVEIMIHIWYSALIPQSSLVCLREKVLPLLDAVRNKVHAKPVNGLFSNTWTFGSCTLQLVLEGGQWASLPSYLEVPEGLSASKAQQVRTASTMGPEKQDFVDRSLYSQLPEWRVSKMDFRKNGILLPFGSSRKLFDTPNPTFYQTKDVWPLTDSSDPLDSWTYSEITKTAGPAKNDLYGNLYIYVKNVLLHFCERLTRLQIRFHLTHGNILQLPRTLKLHQVTENFFDRIDVSNIIDLNYFGPTATLETIGPLLKGPDQNPYACLVGLFLGATEKVLSEFSVADQQISGARLKRLNRYFPKAIALITGDLYHPDSMRAMSAQEFFRDFDDLFDRFIHKSHLLEITKVAKLEIKKKNTIVEPWPVRLGENATDEDFSILSSSCSHSGCERYVEWKRID